MLFSAHRAQLKCRLCWFKSTEKQTSRWHWPRKRFLEGGSRRRQTMQCRSDLREEGWRRQDLGRGVLDWSTGPREAQPGQWGVLQRPHVGGAPVLLEWAFLDLPTVLDHWLGLWVNSTPHSRRSELPVSTPCAARVSTQLREQLLHSCHQPLCLRGSQGEVDGMNNGPLSQLVSGPQLVFILSLLHHPF